jgi:hypothetical protein
MPSACTQSMHLGWWISFQFPCAGRERSEYRSSHVKGLEDLRPTWIITKKAEIWIEFELSQPFLSGQGVRHGTSCSMVHLSCTSFVQRLARKNFWRRVHRTWVSSMVWACTATWHCESFVINLHWPGTSRRLLTWCNEESRFTQNVKVMLRTKTFITHSQ